MKICTILGCGKKHRGRGYCDMHLQRYRKHGAVGKAEPLLNRHGLKNTITYSSWCSMKARCQNINHPQYNDYAGREIKVCDRWQGFEPFLADMGARPSLLHTLDRVDNLGNYTPSNCRWATKTEQSYNRGTFKNNTSGIRGVYYIKRTDRWVAILHYNNTKYQAPYTQAKEESILHRKMLEKTILPV